MKVFTATPHFFSDFKRFFPSLQIAITLPQIKSADLIIFTGGEDINPEIYGEKNKYSSFSKARDDKEIFALAYALEMEKKILGVCRGHQLINAYLGGKLIQDIQKELSIYHDWDNTLIFEDNYSYMEEIVGKNVNSMHHQAVVSLPREMNLVATSIDGIIEMCISENNKILTTQFHPEFMGHHPFFNWVKKEWFYDTNIGIL